MRKSATIWMALAAIAAAPAPALAQAAERQIGAATRLEIGLKPGEAHAYVLPLKAGESAEVAVVQAGIDVVVEVKGPDGRVIDLIDSPNGRQGDEPVEIMAKAPGRYRLTVRPIADNEPAGVYRVEVRALRDRAATQRALAERRGARAEAAAWLAARAAAIPPTGVVSLEARMDAFDALARRVRVLGLGEATHGSREFGDLRLALTKRLVERGGYRLVVLEDGASRLRALEPYVMGKAPDAAFEQLLAHGWIGRRTRRELVEWARVWNLAHPGDPVRLVGVDAQDHAASRAAVKALIEEAYGPEAATRWAPFDTALAAADAESRVFGNSSVTLADRTAAMEAAAVLEADRAFLVARFGRERVDAARMGARDLLQFTDYNVRGGMLSHWRDWHMATNLLAALEAAGPNARAVFWAHNAHVAHRPDTERVTGSVLRTALGCGYAAVAVTFGEGDFLAQRLNDTGHRLEITRLPAPPLETIETVAGEVGRGGLLAAWDCKTEPATLPAWLRQARLIHWIGGVYAPDALPSQAFQPFDLTRDFDAIAYLPRVTAEAAPADWP